MRKDSDPQTAAAGTRRLRRSELKVECLKLKAPESSFFASSPLDSDLESFFLDLRSPRPGRA